MKIKIFKGMHSNRTYTLEYNPSAPSDYNLRTLLYNEMDETIQCDDFELFSLLDNYFLKKRGILY